MLSCCPGILGVGVVLVLGLLGVSVGVVVKRIDVIWTVERMG